MVNSIATGYLHHLAKKVIYALHGVFIFYWQKDNIKIVSKNVKKNPLSFIGGELLRC